MEQQQNSRWIHNVLTTLQPTELRQPHHYGHVHATSSGQLCPRSSGSRTNKIYLFIYSSSCGLGRTSPASCYSRPPQRHHCEPRELANLVSHIPAAGASSLAVKNEDDLCTTTGARRDHTSRQPLRRSSPRTIGGDKPDLFSSSVAHRYSSTMRILTCLTSTLHI